MKKPLILFLLRSSFIANAQVLTIETVTSARKKSYQTQGFKM